MAELIWYFLPGIVFLGLVTSYQDIKEGKIRNKWVLAAIMYAIIAYAVLGRGTGISAEYFSEFGTNVFFSAALCAGLSMLNIWSPGDGKLFFAYALLMPLTAYPYYIKYFQASALLVLTFAPYFLYFAFRIIYNEPFAKKMKTLREILYRRIPLVLVYIFVIEWIFKFVSVESVFIRYGLIILIAVAVERGVVIFSNLAKIRVNRLAVFGIIAVMRIIFDYEAIASTAYLGSLFAFSAGFALIRHYIFELGVDYFTEDVELKDVKKGMILLEDVVKEKKGYIKIPALEQELQGLSENEAERIRKIYKHSKVSFSSVKTAKTLPFAPFLFFGVVAVVLLGFLI